MAQQQQQQQQQQAPAQPKSVLRGHRAQVHVASFVRRNQRLASGDADGFVVLWDLTIMRPRAVWRAHTNAVLGISAWGDDKIITEGRDHRLVVWKITDADEDGLSTALPLDDSAPERPQPWVLHILEVNTMNFCSFAMCSARPGSLSEDILVAVPNTLASESVDIYALPSQTRQHTVHLGSKTEQKGMVMALSLFWQEGSLVVVAGYENGLAVAARRRRSGSWDIIYKAKVHAQPVLALDVSPDMSYFLTSGADDLIAKHPIPSTIATPRSTGAPIPTPGSESRGEGSGNANGPSLLPAGLATSSATSTPQPRTRTAPVVVETQPLKTVHTKHAGQQSLRLRSDGRIFATAGWDGRARVYSTKTLGELAVLKWHGVGCYAVAFADVGESRSGNEDGATAEEEGATAVAITPKPGDLSVKNRRIKMAKEAHWLAIGAKDGKISLWDVY
ncbi:WD40-repeat-containing domain protein [Xylariomycetidae sp. FL0641]|nr:WD40-repeat-containing domain protein [Xylariomycetidae sp. FL0641]